VKVEITNQQFVRLTGTIEPGVGSLSLLVGFLPSVAEG
jgi:hypothetical protein